MTTMTRFVKPKIDKYIQLYSKYARVEEGTYLYEVDNIMITNEGYNFTSAPTITITAPPTGGTQAQATASISDGKVSSITVTEKGSGYTSMPSVTISDTFFQANSGQSGYSVKSLIIEDVGYYDSVPILTISPPDISGGVQATAVCSILNNNINTATITVNGTGYTSNPTVSLVAPEGISSIDITNYGQWYSLLEPPTVVISPPDISGGIQATASLIVADTVGNELESITVTNSGSGYTSPPTISFDNTLYEVYSTHSSQGGSMRYAVVTNGGSGYTSAPSIEVELPDNPYTGEYRQATARCDINGSGEIINVSIMDIGMGYIAKKQWTCTIYGGGGSGGSAVFYNTYGFGATAVATLDESNMGKIRAYITDGSGATASGVIKAIPQTATKYSWELDTPIEVNENAIIQVVDRVFEGITGDNLTKSIPIRMYEIGTQSIVNTKNISRNNASFYQGKIIDIGLPSRVTPNDIKLEIQPQVIDRITLGLNHGIHDDTGIDASTEFFISLKVTEQEPKMLEYGSLNNLNVNQF